MWWYIGTALAGLAILVLQKYLRKSPTRSPPPQRITPTPAPPVSPPSNTEALPTKNDVPQTITETLKKSGDGSTIRQSPARPESSNPRTSSGSFLARSPSGRNFSPAVKKGPSEVMLTRRGGSAIQRPGDRSPRSVSPHPTASAPRPPASPIRTSPSPIREPIESVSQSPPPRSREIRMNESPVDTPVRQDSSLEIATSTNSTTTEATTESTPSEDKLCVLDAKFEIDYWQLLPQLGDMIGEGGYAEVYKAQYNNTTVAVKKFKIDYDALAQGLPPMDLELIRNEVLVLSRLEHPNVMRFFGATLNVPNICIVTEFLEKGSLDDLLRDLSRPLTRRQRAKLGLDTARGLAYMHSLDPLIIHRDIKSANVLLDKDLNGKLSDFGLAKIKSAAFEAPPSIGSSSPSGWKVLENSTPVGTAGWAAPEMLAHKPYNELVDVYSFGVFLWELYARVAPWEGMDEHTLTDAVLEGKRLEIPKDTPAEMVALIKECWEEYPWKRPIAADVAKRLEKICADTPVE